jgi:F-type H+-transporting ATPase subunit b
MRSADLFRVLKLATLVACVLILLPAPVLAAEGHESGHESAGGELGFSGFKRYDLGIWTLFVFGCLLAILSKYAWPNIKQGLEKREASIRSALDEAKQNRIDADNKLAEAKRHLDDAAAQAKAIVDDARKAADALKANEKEAAGKEIEARKQQAERDIAAERDAMLKDLYDQAVQLATLMSEKALRRVVSTADHSRFLDESLAELKAESSKA